MHIRAAWDDYFTGNPTLIQTKEYGSTQTLSNTNVYVSNCLFRSITSESSGGALSCTSVTCLLVESSSFISCKANGYGGAIYFCNTNSGQCVLHEICGCDCFSTSGSLGQFSYIYVYNVASSKNYVNYSSISRCVTDISGAWYTMRNLYGKIRFKSVNISMNRCYGRSGIISEPQGDSNAAISSLLYSSFTDNNATGYTCIMLWTTGSKHEVKNCNILRNTQVTNSEGTIFANRNVMIEDSCILENNATYIFYQYSSYTITLSNCTVDSTLNNKNLITQNTATKSFIHALNHMSTLNCHSEYDSVGTLTPITPPLFPSNKQRLYYSCEIFFNQHRLRDLPSFHSIFIFIFNFIHSYSSSNPLH
jgi:hypothetical protein